MVLKGFPNGVTLGQQLLLLCYRGEPWVLTVARAYDVSEAELRELPLKEAGKDDES